MSNLITLFCEETPGLKLGPGTTTSFGDAPAGDVIVFRDGFATFAAAEFPSWRAWIDMPGTPNIRIVDEGIGEATSGIGAIECPICGKKLASQFALNGHLRSHAPVGASTSNPKSVAPAGQ